jgi:epoxyqueuosine reductase
LLIIPADKAMIATRLKQTLLDAGFALVGIAPAVSPLGLDRLQDWLKAGYAGEMSYIERRQHAYAHPENVLPQVASIVMAAWNYQPQGSPATLHESRQRGRIATYAQLPEDYHHWLKEKLQPAISFLREHFPNDRTRTAIDTAPLLEREYASLAGLGWFGKNTMLIDRQQGSYLLLAGILTQTELPPDAPHQTNHCGSCTRCLEICPTEAFPQPGVLDARKCISYLTIEQKGFPAEPLRKGIGPWLLGCDLCQDVCPWNTKRQKVWSRAQIANEQQLTTVTDNETREASLVEAENNPALFLTISEEAFQERFGKTPLERPGRAGMARNAAVVLGNIGTFDDWPAIEHGLADSSAVVRSACAWAAVELALREPLLKSIAETALRNRLPLEDNSTEAVATYRELRAALDRLTSPPA